jgi:very-short-patch-repair endonuclease
LDVRGRLVNKNLNKYLIKWDSQSRSKLQFKVKQFLKPYWLGSICYEECPVFGTLLRVDILNATYKIAIEVNGQQHSEFHYFHNGNPFEFLQGIKRDVQKREWLERNEFKVVEINYDEVDSINKKFFKEKFGVIL